MKVWSIYNPEDGLFTGEVIAGGSRTLKDNMTPGLEAVEGRFHYKRHRVDLATGEVVDYEPPPDPVTEQRERHDKARRRILALEQRQFRPLRELALDPANDDARARLETVEAEIAALRVELT